MNCLVNIIKIANMRPAVEVMTLKLILLLHTTPAYSIVFILSNVHINV